MRKGAEEASKLILIMKPLNDYTAAAVHEALEHASRGLIYAVIDDAKDCLPLLDSIPTQCFSESTRTLVDEIKRGFSTGKLTGASVGVTVSALLAAAVLPLEDARAAYLDITLMGDKLYAVCLAEEYAKQIRKAMLMISLHSLSVYDAGYASSVQQCLDEYHSTAAPVFFARGNCEDLDKITAPEFEWLFEGILRRGIVGTLAAEGGDFKSTIALQLAVSACTGATIFPSWKPVRPMKVMAIFMEDDEAVIRARLRACWQLFENVLPDSKSYEQILKDNFYFVAGKTAALLKDEGKGLTRTSLYTTLQRELLRFKPDLIIIDMLQGACAADTSLNHLMSTFMHEMMALGDLVNASVLLLHHFNKDEKRTWNRHRVRGASAIVDESRIVFCVTRPYSANNESTRKIVLEVVKSNYTPTGRKFEFSVCDGMLPMLKELQTNEDRLAHIARLAAKYMQDNKLKGTADQLAKRQHGAKLRDYIKEQDSAFLAKELLSALRFGSTDGIIRCTPTKSGKRECEIFSATLEKTSKRLP